MNRLLPCVLAAGAATAVAMSQGVLPLAQNVRFGAIRANFSGPCGWSTVPTTSADEGMVMFLPDGSCTVQVDNYSVCPGGTLYPGPVQGASGTYLVGTDGTLTVRWQPNQPGVDDDVLMLRADGSVMVRTRYSDRSEDALVMVGIALSGGKGRGSLTGAYRVVRLLERNAVTGFAVQGDIGTILFDGIGGYVDQGTRRLLPQGGTATTGTYGPLNGTYTVDPDGTVATGVGALGAVSDDCEVFFWQRRAGTDVSLTIGLRQGSNYDSAMAAGPWRVAVMQDAVLGTLPQAELRTDWGTMELQPWSSGGTLVLDAQRVVSIPTQTTASPYTPSDTFAISAQGDLSLFDASPAPMPGALAADGSVLAALVVPGDAIGLAIGIAGAHWPTPVGIATPGTNGVAPAVLPLGGFPYVGNDAFGYAIVGGRGGAPAGLVVTGGVTAGLPMFGGLVFVDPNRLFGAHALQLSGANGQPGVGAAAVPLPLPLVPRLAGIRIASQAFVLDPGAPQGVAMSRALEFVLCR